MGGAEGAAFVFLAASAFAGEEIREGAFYAGAFDGLVNVETDVIFGGELEGFLIVEDAELGVVEFALALDDHHGTGVARLDVMDAEVGVVFVGGVELGFVVVDEADGFVVADDFYTGGAGVAGDASEVAVGLSLHEVSGLAILEPVSFPAAIPTFHQEAAEVETTAGVDVFEGVFGGGAVARAGSPSPFADKHGPPNAEEFERLDPREIRARWVVEIEHDVVFGEADRRAGNHHHAPGGVER